MREEYDDKPFIVLGRKWLQVDNPVVDWRTNCIHVKRNDGSTWTIHPRIENRIKKAVEFLKISIKKLSKLVRKKGNELFAIQVRPGTDDIQVSEDFKDIVAEYSDIFVEELPDNLPPKRDLEFEINLKVDEPPPVRPVIRLSPEEIK